MKKGKWILCIVVVLAVVVLATGCVGNPNAALMSRISSLEAQVDSLWQEIYDLQDELYYGQDGGQPVYPGDPEQSGEPSLEPLPAPTESTPPEGDYASAVADLTARVQEVTGKAANVSVPESYEERMTAFLDMKTQIKGVEYEIDALDDDLELEYKTGGLTWAEYRSYEQQLDQLEDQLDTAKDQLEIKLGVDD